MVHNLILFIQKEKKTKKIPCEFILFEKLSVIYLFLFALIFVIRYILIFHIFLI